MIDGLADGIDGDDNVDNPEGDSTIDDTICAATPTLEGTGEHDRERVAVVSECELCCGSGTGPEPEGIVAVAADDVGDMSDRLRLTATSQRAARSSLQQMTCLIAHNTHEALQCGCTVFPPAVLMFKGFLFSRCKLKQQETASSRH